MTRAETYAERMEMYLAGKTDKQIAYATHYTEGTITNWRWRHHLPDKNCTMQIELAERMELWKSGMTDRQIADAQGRTPEAIYAWRKRKGLRVNHG